MNTGVSRAGLPTAGAGSPTAWGARTGTCPGSSCSGTRRASRGGPLNWRGSCPRPTRGRCSARKAARSSTSSAPGHGRRRPAAQLDLLARLNGEHLSRHWESLTRADRGVRAGLPHADGGDGLVDFLAGVGGDRALYGLENPASRSFGQKCLMARRLVERGVVRPGLQRRRVGRPQRPGRQPPAPRPRTCRSTAC